MRWMKKYARSDGFKKRGVLYMMISLIGMSYEFFFVDPIRLPVLFLWIGVFGIGVIVYKMLRDPDRTDKD